MINLFLLAIEIPKIAESHSGTFDWRPIISSIILCIIAGFVKWWFDWRKGSSRRDTNHFIAFMDESAEFREEVRRDRERLKEELNQLMLQKRDLQSRLEELERNFKECSETVLEHSKQLKLAKEENEMLQEKIKKLKEVLMTLNIPAD